MTTASDLTRRVTFQARTLDENQDPLGPWADAYTCAAKIEALKGGETVKGQRLSGNQPVIIIVRRCTDTRDIDNAWRALDARDLTRGIVTAWNITSAIWNERDGMMEFLAVQDKGATND